MKTTFRCLFTQSHCIGRIATGLLCLCFYLTLQQRAFSGDNLVELEMIVDGYEAANGILSFSLYNSSDTYLEDGFINGDAELGDIDDNGIARIVVQLPKGDYAVAMYHDKNGNGEFDKNFLGIPKEKYGFSNNFRPTFRAPRYDEVKFTVSDARNTISITLQ